MVAHCVIHGVRCCLLPDDRPTRLRIAHSSISSMPHFVSPPPPPLPHSLLFALYYSKIFSRSTHHTTRKLEKSPRARLCVCIAHIYEIIATTTTKKNLVILALCATAAVAAAAAFALFLLTTTAMISRCRCVCASLDSYEKTKSFRIHTYDICFANV